MAQQKYQYEWYTVMIQYSFGWMKTIFKAKNKENVIKQINKEVDRCSTDNAKTMALPAWKRPNIIVSVDWDSLTLDHVGYNRLF